MTLSSRIVACRVSPTSAGMRYELGIGLTFGLGALLCLGAALSRPRQGSKVCPSSNSREGYGGAQDVRGSLWVQPPSDSVPPPQSWGSRSAGRRRVAAAAAPVWHSTAFAMAPMTAEMARMRIQHNAVSMPGPREGSCPPAPPATQMGCGSALMGQSWAVGLSGVTPALPCGCAAGGAKSPQELSGGVTKARPIAGTPLLWGRLGPHPWVTAPSPCPQHPSSSAPSSRTSAVGRQRLGSRHGRGT